MLLSHRRGERWENLGRQGTGGQEARGDAFGNWFRVHYATVPKHEVLAKGYSHSIRDFHIGIEQYIDLDLKKKCENERESIYGPRNEPSVRMLVLVPYVSK